MGNAESESDSDAESLESDEERQRAIQEIRGEVDSDDSDDEQGESENEELVMKFDYPKKAKKKQVDESGIMALKFMQRAEQKQKEQLKENASRLIK